MHLSTYTGAKDETMEGLNPLGNLMYSTASILSYSVHGKRLKEASDEEIRFPGGEDRTFPSYFGFAYLMMFNFLTEMTQAPPDAQVYVCNENLYTWNADVGEVILIYTDFEKWRKRETYLNNIKFMVFAHVELLELIYPSSESCSKVNSELYMFFD